MNKLPTNIHLSVRRWRDKTHGNSYFSARVYADGELIARIPFQYGYGNAPQAEALLAAFGPAPKAWTYIDSYCRARGIRYTEDDCKARKREVIAHGKED